ncbi:MAG: hypothetical protein AB7O21_20950, partial [Gammaproteobacteria bacterium]
MTTRAVWRAWLLAAGAAGYLVVMFMAGQLPEHGHFNAFEASGPLREPPASVTRVQVVRGARQWILQRVGGQWTHAAAPLAAPLATHLDDGLRFLHASAPVRVLEDLRPEEAVGLRDGTRVVLANDSGVLFEFVLGGRSPDGILRYVQARGAPGILLMSGFVGDAWD